jgi:SAM-dependent methyltransferase
MNSYQDYENWKDWKKVTFGSFTPIDIAYFTAELKRTGIDLNKPVRLYEIGFGNGAFAGYAQSLGYQYSGSEVNQALIERARNFGLPVYEHGIKQVIDSAGPDTYDAIVAFDVLEHLELAEIKNFLIDARVLLKEGGTVLARLPSGDSPFGRAIFHGDITHKTTLGSSAVRQLAQQTGYEVIDIGPPKLPILGVGFIRGIRRSVIRLAQSIASKLINLVFHDGQPRIITANLVFVLKKKQAAQD